MPQVPSKTSETYVPDRLIAGLTQPVSRNGTLISGQNLKRGALLGKITTGGKLTLSLSASSDGSQTPFAILADDVDASAGDVVGAPYYEAGEFNENAVIYGAGHTPASVHDGLRALGIFLKPSVPA